MIGPKHHEIWLFRHGETAWSLTGQHTGRTDLPLNSTGRRQAEALGQSLNNRRFGLVLCSPLARAVETCQLAGYGDVARYIDDLMEWNYGEYEGLRPDEILEKRPGWTIWKDGMPGGETVEQVGERARKVIVLADATEGDVAIFSHGHLLRVLAACWLNLPPDGGRYFDLSPASTSVLGYSGDAPVIRKWNQDVYLAGTTGG
jgi:broad specificity phosphatase PhoE